MGKHIWKTLKTFKNIPDDVYQVSITGDVRLKGSKNIRPTRKIANKKYHPYYAVYLKNKDGKGEWILVHQLVAHCFVKIPEKYDGYVEFKDIIPDHLDNNGLNNIYTNLEWKTRAENVKKAFGRGEINICGERNSNAIITDSVANDICRLLEENKSYDDIISILELPNTAAYRKLLIRIKNRYAWTHISKNYRFKSTDIKYNDKQLETVNRLPLIQEMIRSGKGNMEIAQELFPDADENEIKRRARTISGIRNKKIFKELLT